MEDLGKRKTKKEYHTEPNMLVGIIRKHQNVIEEKPNFYSNGTLPKTKDLNEKFKKNQIIEELKGELEVTKFSIKRNIKDFRNPDNLSGFLFLIEPLFPFK